MIIACDVDNVINNLQEAVVNLFNERCGAKYTVNDFHDYNVENVLSVKDAVIMKNMYGERGIYDYVKPLAGSQDALQKLINDGHHVYLVTDALPQNYNEKIDWIHHFFPFINNAHIVSMKHKHLFRCDLMIEDKISNLLSGISYHRVCMDQPWNRNGKDYVYDIHRCTNWAEVLDVIDELKEEE